MSHNKKFELVYNGEKIMPFMIGYSIGTVYTTNSHDFHRFELFNVGYCLSTKEFYYNKNIHLPKKLIKYFESKFIDRDKLEKEMNEIGIYNKYDIDRLLEEYNNAQVQAEIIKEKTMKLKSALNKKIK